MPIRPPVPPDNDGPDNDRRARRPEMGSPPGSTGAGPGEPDTEPGAAGFAEDDLAEDEVYDDGLEDTDPAARPGDLTADQLHAGLDGDGPGEPAGPVAEWRVDKRLTWIKLVLAVIFLAGPWVVGASAASKLVGLVAGAGLVVSGIRDLLVPVRLRIDAAGLRVVTGYANHRELGWKDLERIRLDSRARLGLRTELLEIDAGEQVYFLSRYDLSMPPADALDRIRELRGVGGR